MIRRLISSCLSFVLGGLLLPLVSFAAISGTTCDARSMTTTTSAAIAERATSTSVNQDGETELQSITSGPVRTLYDIRRGLVAAKNADTVRLQHGTTRYRAERMVKRGPDPNFVEPGGGPPAGGFSTARPEGPHAWGSPRDYAKGKAEIFPAEGGPVILEIEVPQNVIDQAIDVG